MRVGTRTAITLLGVVLLYGALVLPGLRPLLPPGASGVTLLIDLSSIFPVLAFILATAALLFTTGWALTNGKLSLAGAVLTVLFYLINPVILNISVAPAVSAAPQEAFYVLLFCVSWVWMRHWSAFMRSVVLMILFCVGLGLGAHSCFWVALAMVPWVICNRKPGVAVATLVFVTCGGSALFAVARAFVELLGGGALHWGPPFQSAALRLRTLWLMPSFFVEHPRIAERQFAATTALVSFPWIALALWSAGRRLWVMVRDRRSDATSVMSTLVVLLLIAACGSASMGNVLTSLMALATLVTLSSPLVAADVSQRDYLLSRPARWTALIGAVGAALVAWQPLSARQTGALSVAAILLSGAIASSIPSLRKLTFQRRLRAILVGASLGGCLVAAILR